MIHHDFPQGSPEWLDARLGCASASNMARVVTESGKLRKAKSGGGLSQGAETYLHELLAEWLIQMPVKAEANQYMERGTEMEDEAACWYAFEHGADVRTCGFFTTDCGRVGASPDRLVGSDGLLEIKVPGIVAHVANMLEMTREYDIQVQTQLFVTGRKWCDLLSYNPTLKSMVRRIDADMEFQGNLHEALFGEGGFLHWMDAYKGILQHFVDSTPPCQCMTTEGKCGSREGVTDCNGVWVCTKHVKTLEEIFG